MRYMAYEIYVCVYKYIYTHIYAHMQYKYTKHIMIYVIYTYIYIIPVDVMTLLKWDCSMV